METPSFYDFEANGLTGEKMKLDQFKGKVVLVVNTASACGLTPQYEGLEKLYQKYKDRGFVVLGFPCNQFGNQEEGTSEEIQQFCQVNYGVSFPMFEKIEVNGKKAHPIFKFLKSKLSGGLLGSKIKWNFTKFLLDKDGVPVKRFGPTSVPKEIEKDIEKLL
ncbi:glutathione peroxidase [Muricauda oceani]|uniref:Glutathione peroxidase n=1 Tax=Flagellimonas oceani TaxID=2698672 RepID=A0A6G7J231_9FLAO|nr:glutathione peroxidase [Allomuricauda oceani]MBW8241164.1 glutathione peroxidase [Allomuricauda oceani]QII44826.1 glutathione peroxidase [Allomuricauda oceani]